MKSQYIVIWIIFLMFYIIMAFYQIVENYNFYYETNIEKYYAIMLKEQITKVQGDVTLENYVNATFWNFCKENNMICYYNGTYIILKSNRASIILKT